MKSKYFMKGIGSYGIFYEDINNPEVGVKITSFERKIDDICVGLSSANIIECVALKKIFKNCENVMSSNNITIISQKLIINSKGFNEIDEIKKKTCDNSYVYVIKLPKADIDLFDLNISLKDRIYFFENVAEQLIYGLHEIHSRGFIHGDFKPSNIQCKFDKYNNLKLWISDFGGIIPIGKSAHSICTLSFAPPECIVNDKKIIAEPQFDIFSLGMTLLSFLVFESQSLTDILFKNNKNKQEVLKEFYSSKQKFNIYNNFQVKRIIKNKEYELTSNEIYKLKSYLNKIDILLNFDPKLRPKNINEVHNIFFNSDLDTIEYNNDFIEYINNDLYETVKHLSYNYHIGIDGFKKNTLSVISSSVNIAMRYINKLYDVNYDLIVEIVRASCYITNVIFKMDSVRYSLALGNDNLKVNSFRELIIKIIETLDFDLYIVNKEMNIKDLNIYSSLPLKKCNEIDNYIYKNPNITYKVRKIIINWMLEIYYEMYDLNFLNSEKAIYSVCKSIVLFNTYLSNVENVNNRNLKLIGLASIYLERSIHFDDNIEVLFNLYEKDYDKSEFFDIILKFKEILGNKYINPETVLDLNPNINFKDKLKILLMYLFTRFSTKTICRKLNKYEIELKNTKSISKNDFIRKVYERYSIKGIY